MRSFIVFIVSLPLLILAILWLPIGFLTTIAGFPLWIFFKAFMWPSENVFKLKIFKIPLFFMFEAYCIITGLMPGFSSWVRDSLDSPFEWPL